MFAFWQPSGHGLGADHVPALNLVDHAAVQFLLSFH